MFGRSNKQKNILEEKILDVNASMQGTLSFKEPVNLKINGHFEGMLDLRGNLTVGPKAVINANINGDDITIGGKVHGDINARVRLRILSTAQLVGNIRAPIVSVEEGASFHGNCHMAHPMKTSASSAGSTGGEAAGGDYLTIDELARFLEVDAAVVKDWARVGKIPALKEGDSWRFERSKIENWLVSEQLK
jgi:excisionase family DNA binding protein